MAKETQRPGRLKSAVKINPSSDQFQPPSRSNCADRNLTAQQILRDRAERVDSGRCQEPAFQLSGPQHAQFLQAVLKQEQTGIAMTGPDGTIQHINHALANLLLYQPEELKGQVLEGFACRFIQAPKALETSQVGRFRSPDVSELVRKSGEPIPCFVESHALCERGGEVTHFVVFVTDARSRREAAGHNLFERAVFQSQSLQVLGMLAAGVAHDFNNALEVIIGFASLARIRLSSADPLHEPLKIIEESAKGAAGLARQLLDVSKDKTDEEHEIDVGNLINSVVAIISRTFDRKIRIDHRIGPNLPWIKGIRNRLEQAILNLCINARDALQEGGCLTLAASCQTLKAGDPRLSPSNEPGTYVRISIRDNGVGMTPEILEKIFDPLFTTKKAGQGSGLGLAMVNRIVKEARGFISVASVPGKGSEFSLYLPAVLSQTSRQTSTPMTRLVSGRGRILVVDDEPRVLEFLEKGLTRLGYEVVPAESGNRACEIYSRQSNEINCVLLDLIMPGMSGLETYSRLMDMNPGVRVILSSGYSSRRVRHDAAEAGSPEFLEKPYTLEELSLALQKIQQN